LLSAAVVMLLAGFTTHWLIAPDSAIHLSVARSLAGGGPFTSPSGAHTRINPGLPYVLAGLFRLCGPDAFWAANLFMLLTALAALALNYWLFLLHAGRPLAVFITFLLGCSWNFYFHAFQILTDMPFLVGVLLFLIGMERMERPHLGRRWLNWVLLLSGLGIMSAFRMVVVTVLAAAVFYLLYRVVRSHQRLRYATIGLAAVTVVAAAWLLDPRRPAPGRLMPKEKQVVEDLYQHLGGTLRVAVTQRIPDMVGKETTKAIYGTNLGPLLGWTFALPLLACAAALIRRQVFWGLVVLVFLLQWPLFYFEHRYFLAVQPLWIYSLYLGGVWFAGFFNPARAGRIIVYLLALYFVGNLSQIGRTIWVQRHSDPLWVYDGGKYAGLPEFGRAIQAATPGGAVLLMRPALALDLTEPLTYLAGDRRRAVAFDLFNAAVTESALTNVYVVWERDQAAPPIAVGERQKSWLQPGPPLLQTPHPPHSPPWTLRRLTPLPPVTTRPAL
jgi:4-amino-4-deoxy-L-arabinose transferase-like glycosyltransferase